MSRAILFKPAWRAGIMALALIAIAALAPGAWADATRSGAVLGPVTHLALPRFVSLKAAEGNARRGPGLTHRIDWVFKRRNMPLKVTAEFGHWRRVQDQDGAGGWMHYALLSGVRTVLVTRDMLALRNKPNPSAPANARLELGVIGHLGKCIRDWCIVRAGGYRGWAPKSALWGVEADEIRK